jgi:hypothetical protein
MEPFNSRRAAVHAHHGMVASSQPLAAQVGLQVLKDGGNAVDAAIGVYLVPNEKADQFRAMANENADFRAMVQGGLGAIYRVVYSDKADPDIHSSEASQMKATGETSRTEAQPDVPAGSQPGGLPIDAAAPQAIPDRDVVAPSSSSPEQADQPSHALETSPSETVPPGITDRDVAAPSSSSPEQADQPSHALNTNPSGTVTPNSSPNIESDAPTPVAPETAKKKPLAKKVKPKSSPTD